ncbi:F-box protein [Sporobolomyces koalae]|uniref:F-box protein n=1 Tax=Sporobolomyces koalae TaxID=500713 RepID=UPI003177E1B3
MATRTSARIKSKGQAMLALDDSSDCGAKDDSDDETFEASKKKPKAGKRQKTGKSSTEKKVNQLEAFASMPLDILCLIMEQMDPKTLLAMSRTCSMFRSVLRSPRGKNVWKIMTKLRDLGYEESDLQSPDLAHHPDVCNSRDLTDNVWKRIRPILKRFLDSKRSERLEKAALERMEQYKPALRRYYNEWVSGVPDSYCYPPFEKFLTFPSVAALYEPEDDGRPMAQRLSSAKSTVDRDIQQYAMEFEENVRQNLLVAYRTLDPTFEAQEQLLLVNCTSAMTCPRYSVCRTIRTFPAILDHYRRCARGVRAEALIKSDSFTTSPAQIQAIRQTIAAVNASSPSDQQLSDSSPITELFALGNWFDCVTCMEGGKTQPDWCTNRRPDLAIKAQNWSSMLGHIECMHQSTPPEIRYIPQISPELGIQTPEQTDKKEAAE